MRKVIRKIVLIGVLFSFLMMSLITYQGYKEYHTVVSDVPIEEKINKLKKDNFSDYDEIAPLFLDAIRVTEDARFYLRDSPLDRIAIVRAIKVNIKQRGFYEGGSTIPQQLAKNLYFDHSASLKRKVSEYFIARDIMRLYNHNEILSFYVNSIYYGDGYTGITSASRGYFNVLPLELDDFQASILAGLPQAPSIYQLSTNYEGALKRQNHVLNRLVDEHIITEEEKIEILLLGGIEYEEKND